MQTVKGTRDILPDDMRLREDVISKLKRVFEIYGFQPMDTPALESWEVLSAKGAGGEDVLCEAYDFEDKGKRRIGLRYEFTVSLARVMASNPNMVLPFKRYQTGKIWRYGDIAKGRLREFSQFDGDIVGSDSPLADAEVISCAIDCFKALGFKDFVIKLSSRKLLSSLANYAGVPEDKFSDVFTIIDKLDKVGIKEVEKQLAKEVPKDSAKKIVDLISIDGSNEEVLKKIGKIKPEGTDELRQILSSVNDKSKVKIDLSLARGFNYYTGPVFEIYGSENIGSLGGGGRYDNLIGILSGKDIPATGIGIGLDRTIEVMKDTGLAKPLGGTRAFVIFVNESVKENAIEIARNLRSSGIAADYDLRSRSLSGQMKYASSINASYAVIVGERELKEKSVKLRDMKSGKEELVKISGLAKKF